MTSWYLVPLLNSTCWICVLCSKNCVWKNCLRNVRSAFLVSSQLSTWGALSKLVVCAWTPTRLRLYVPGRNRPRLKNCSNFSALLFTTHSTSCRTPILLHRWQTWPVLSNRGTGVLSKTYRLCRCASYCATHLYWNCLTLRGHLWLIQMHIRMQLGLFCCNNMMMVYTPLRTIVASMLRQNTIMVGARKNCWRYSKRVSNGDVILTVYRLPFILTTNHGSIYLHNRTLVDVRHIGSNVWMSCPSLYCTGRDRWT